MVNMNIRAQLGCLCLLLGVWVSLGWGNLASANLTYVFSGVGSGSLNEQQLTAAPFTITAQADPTQVSNPVFGIFRLKGGRPFGGQTIIRIFRASPESV